MRKSLSRQTEEWYDDPFPQSKTLKELNYRPTRGGGLH